MAKITRFSGRSDWIELDFVERERTPSELMKLGIRLIWLDYHFRIPFEIEVDVERSRKAIHD